MVRVDAVEVLDGYRVRLGFTDGTCIALDLDPYLVGPVFDEVRSDEALWSAVRVDPEFGTIVWPNGADICPDVLYHGRRPAACDEEASSSAA